MSTVVELILAAISLGAGAFLTRVLIRRNEREALAGQAAPSFGGELLTNALGFLVIGSFFVGTGLFAAALSGRVPLPG